MLRIDYSQGQNSPCRKKSHIIHIDGQPQWLASVRKFAKIGAAVHFCSNIKLTTTSSGFSPALIVVFLISRF